MDDYDIFYGGIVGCLFGTLNRDWGFFAFFSLSLLIVVLLFKIQETKKFRNHRKCEVKKDE